MTKSLTNKLNKCRNKLTKVINEKKALQERLTFLNESIFNLNLELNSQTTGTKRKSKRKRKRRKRSKRSKRS